MGGRLNIPGRVSVVVNCYNDEDYISQCLNSLINQSYDNLEIVMVDGNSTDHTVEIARELLYKSGRLYLMYDTNGPERYTPLGLMWGYLVGAGNSTGEFLTFHGSDDVSHPDRIKLMVDSMKDGIIMSYSSLLYTDDSMRVIGKGNGDANDAIYNAVVNKTDDPTPVHITGFTTLFHKWAYFTEQSYMVGSYFWESAHTLKMYALGDFVYVPDAIYYFRNSPRQRDSATGSKERTRIQGYDYNELHFGKYNYAIDSVTARKLKGLEINDCTNDEHWSKYIGLRILEWKKRAKVRINGNTDQIM